MRRLFLAAAVCGVLAQGCLVEAPGTVGSNAEKAPPPKVLSNAPPLQLQNGALLDDKVEIVGVKIEPGRAIPGDTVQVTAFYKVLGPIDQDYLVFVHVEDVDGKMERMNVDHQPAGGRHPTSQWKKGETVQDKFALYVPPGLQLRGLNIWIGFWHASTDSRMKLQNPDKVRNDGRDRILLATLPVGQ